MPSRYQPLADYLAALPADTAEVTLTVPEIEALLGEPLPASAGKASWWANTPTVGSTRPWRQVGWRAVQVHLRQTPGVVTFVRAATAVSGEPDAPLD